MRLAAAKSDGNEAKPLPVRLISTILASIGVLVSVSAVARCCGREQKREVQSEEPISRQ